MGQYRYSAFTAEGRSEAGWIEAAAEQGALASLEAQGLTVTELVLAPRGSSAPAKRGRGRRRLPLMVQADCADQLAMLLAAGLPIVQAAKIIASTGSNKRLRAAFARVSALLLEGQKLGAAFSVVEAEFDPSFGTVLRIGESPTSRPETFRKLSQTLRSSDQRRSRILAAVAYPAALLIGGLVLIAFLAAVMAPELSKVIRSAGQEPPGFLRFLTEIGQQPTLLTVALVSLIASVVLAAISPSNRVIETVQGLIPPLAELRGNLNWARAMSALNLMLSAGVPLTASLRAASNAAGAGFEQRFLADCAEHVESGGRLRELLAREPRVPASIRELLSVGEETNALESVSGAVAAAMDETASRKIEMLLRLLPPMMTLVIGLMIGLLVYVTMDALLSLNELAF